MDEAILQKLLRKYANRFRGKTGRVSLRPDIPRLKLLDAIGQFAHEVQDESSALLLFDDTFFRNTSNGILVTRDAMYGRGRGSVRFSWDFLNQRDLELHGAHLYIDGTFVMSFRHLKPLERANILDFARDVQALYLGRPVPSLERRGREGGPGLPADDLERELLGGAAPPGGPGPGLPQGGAAPE